MPDSHPSRPHHALIPVAIDTATAVACAVLAWTLIRVGVTEAAGLAERQHLATHAALALAFLALPWAMTSSVPQRVALWAWTTPFVALVFLPPGLRRFAPMVLAAVCVATLHQWIRHELEAPEADGTHGGHGGHSSRPNDLASAALDLATWASAGAAIAILLRPDAVAVPLELRELVEVVVRGVVFGAAAGWLGREWKDHAGGRAALFCGAGCALVVSGPSLTAALMLAATAGVATASRLRAQRAGFARIALLPWAPLAALAPPTAVLLGFSVWGARVRRGWLAALIVSAALGALWLEPRPWDQSVVDLGFAALLFGPIWLAGLLTRRAGATAAPRFWTLASAVTLAIIGLRFFPAHLVLPVIAIQVLRPTTTAAAPVPSLTRAWIASWTVAVLLLASYPWMRPPMLAAQWRWALDDGALAWLVGLGTLAALLVVSALAVAQRRADVRGPRAAWRDGSIALVLLCVTLTALALSWNEPIGAELVQRWPPRTLTAGTPTLEHSLQVADDSAGGGSPTVWIDGAAAASLEVGFGQEIARVRADLPSGRWESSLVLGDDLWDWRVQPPGTRRPDAGPPAPLLFWWTGPLEDATLARRYRARLELKRIGEGAPPWTLRIVRNAGLPAATTLDIHQIAIAGADTTERGSS